MLRSKRSIIAVLSGVCVCLFLTSVARPTCFGFILGILVATSIAHVSSPKEGALLGSLVPVPAGILATWPALKEAIQKAQSPGGWILLILSEMIVILFFLGLGGILGYICGKVLASLSKKETIFL